jgi:hypothetical protein
MIGSIICVAAQLCPTPAAPSLILAGSTVAEILIRILWPIGYPATTRLAAAVHWLLPGKSGNREKPVYN